MERDLDKKKLESLVAISLCMSVASIALGVEVR